MQPQLEGNLLQMTSETAEKPYVEAGNQAARPPQIDTNQPVKKNNLLSPSNLSQGHSPRWNFQEPLAVADPANKSEYTPTKALIRPDEGTNMAQNQ